MQSEARPIYNFKFNGGRDNVYSFGTKNSIEYDVRFKPTTDYVSLDELWRDDFYEIVIEVIAAPDPTYIPADRAILSTIVAIITDFFAVHKRVILYICDDSDSREQARKRKFDNWYKRFGSVLYQKYDLPTVSDHSERFFASIFFRRDNPNRLAVIDAFDRLAMGDK